MDEKSGTSATDLTAVQRSALDESSLEDAEKETDAAGSSAEENGDEATNDAFESLSSEDLEEIDPSENLEEIDSVDDIEDDMVVNFDLDWDDEESVQKGERKRLRRWVIVIAAFFVVVSLCSLASWWLFYVKDPPSTLPDFLDVFKREQETKSSEINSASPVKQHIRKKPATETQEDRDDSSQNRDVLKDHAKRIPTQEPPLAAIFRPGLAEISRLRNQLLKKQKEIRNLQQDYRDQIHVVENEILHEKRKFNVNSFDEAIKNKAIEYGLRTIQRRKIYISNLSIPYNQLHFASEELLFLERLCNIQLKMQSVVKGIKPEKLTKRIDRALKKHRDGFDRLTVQTDNLPSLDLKLLWKELLHKTEEEVRISKRSGNATLPQDQVKTNSQILEEILNGEFSRKRYLTWLSPEGANALSKWSGKVLFLNGLSDLHASVAENLARWKGNWLCLNGLEEISPESARHLARWQGKRLSLNGLKAISDKTAKALCDWQGMELEMVGLTKVSPETINHLKNRADSEKKIYLSQDFRIRTFKGP